jgi:hypothetical protein
MQLFAAGLMRGPRAVIYFNGGCAIDVLDLFSSRAMFSP